MTSQPSEAERFSRILELAKAAVNRQEPELALQQLQEIWPDIRERSGSSISIEYEIIMGDIFCARGDAAAEQHYEEALTGIAQLSQRDPKLEMRAHEHFGDYLRRSAHKPSSARRHYEAAGSIATAEQLREDNARIQLKLILIDMEMDDDPRLVEFQVLKRVAGKKHSTNEHQLAAWHLHTGSDDHIRQGMRYARQADSALEAHFERLLDSVKTIRR